MDVIWYVLYFAVAIFGGGFIGTLLLGSFWTRDESNVTGRDLQRGALVGSIVGLAAGWWAVLYVL